MEITKLINFRGNKVARAARYKPDLHEGFRKQGIAYGLRRRWMHSAPPDDRVNAKLPTPTSKTAAIATYKRDAIYPPTCTLLPPPPSVLFFYSANNDARIMHRPSGQREFNGSRENPPTRQWNLTFENGRMKYAVATHCSVVIREYLSFEDTTRKTPIKILEILFVAKAFHTKFTRLVRLNSWNKSRRDDCN